MHHEKKWKKRDLKTQKCRREALSELASSLNASRRTRISNSRLVLVAFAFSRAAAITAAWASCLGVATAMVVRSTLTVFAVAFLLNWLSLSYEGHACH